MPSAFGRPSYATGYARSAAESQASGLWRGLGGFWTPALGNTGRTLRNLQGDPALDMQHYDSSTPLTTASVPAVVATERGLTNSFNDTTNWRHWGVDVTYPHTTPITLFCFARANSAAGDDMCFFMGDGGEIDKFYTMGLSAAQALGWHSALGGSLTPLGPTNQDDNQWHSWVLTIDTVSDLDEFWFDGKFQQSKDPTALSEITINRIGFGGSLDSTAAFPWNGEILCGGFWNRRLTDNEVRSVHVDPLGLLRLRRTFSVPTATPGGFIPYPYPRGARAGMGELVGGMH